MFRFEARWGWTGSLAHTDCCGRQRKCRRPEERYSTDHGKCIELVLIGRVCSDVVIASTEHVLNGGNGVFMDNITVNSPQQWASREK